MKKLAYVLSVFVAATLMMVQIGCTTPPEDEDADSAEMTEVEEPVVDKEAAKAEIDEVRNNFMAMVESGDYSPMEGMAHPDFTSAGPTGPEWDEFRSHATAGPYPAGAKMVISPMDLTIINDTWAFEMGKTEVTYLPEGAEEAMILHDTYLMIFKNEGDGWKLYREVATNELPAEMEE